MPFPTAFSPAIALVLAMWIYMVNVLTAVPPHSLSAHGIAIAGSLLAGFPLEWLRSRGNRDYAVVFLILLTLAPIVYAYQHA